MLRNRSMSGILTFCFAFVAAPAAVAVTCPPVPADQWFGPFDYRDPANRGERLEIVEQHHFTTEIEQHLTSRVRYIATNLDYTLRVFPNHHAAMMSLIELAEKEQSNRLPGMHYSVECYFDRATAFVPNDGMVPMLRGLHEYRHGNMSEALKRMEEAIEREPNNPNIHYNYGLLLLEAGDGQKAREHAEFAYERDFPLPGLREKLRQAGYWGG